MKKFLLAVSLLAASMFVANEASAQIKAGEGQVSIALESNSSYYAPDKTLEDIGLIKPYERVKGNFGSNDYLKVDYSISNCSLSSANAILFADEPNILTPTLSNFSAKLIAVCPPKATITPSGFS